MATSACHRSQYRERADCDAYSLIAEKANHPHWALERIDIEADPRSRMFDPFDLDRPPMPPDDPASHQYMHLVDGKRGYPRWHINGDTMDVENPYWREYLPLNEDGVLVLDADTAMELALRHSREYQDQLEQLYLSALDVSLQRFVFDSQFFAGYSVDYHADGPLRSGDSQSELSLTTSGRDTDRLRMNKAYTTGANLVVGLANTLIWQFSGPNDYTGTTFLDFTLVQPILREAGRDRVMESLTQTERDLLANVRQMERFRREFYLQITAGGTDSARPNSFMGLLQQQQVIHNQRFNLYALRSNHFRMRTTLQELLSRRDIDSQQVVGQRLQVAQARQSVLNAESNLERSVTQYDSQLDQFKITLGLPPDICVEIEDPMLDRLNLIRRDIVELQEQVSKLQQEVGLRIEEVLDALSRAGETPDWRDTLTARLQELRDTLDEVEVLRSRMMDGDDSQIRRFHADGVKLLSILNESIQQHIDNETEDDSAQEIKDDADLASRIRDEIEGEEFWRRLSTVHRFNMLRDLIHDIDIFRDLLESGGRVNVEWMQTDVNPATRAMYEKYRDVVQTIEDMPDAEAATTRTEITGWLQQDVDPLKEEYDRMTRDASWLVDLDRWRAIPYEVETSSAKSGLNRIRLLERLFAQLVDMLLDTAARLDNSADIDTLPGNVRRLQGRIDDLIAVVPDETAGVLSNRFRREISRPLPQELVDSADNVLELSLVQARARAETVSLVDVNLHPLAAVEIARANRRDWMNARATLVDAWRLIEVRADDLESYVDVLFSGDLGTRDNNPLKFDTATGTLRAGVRFDAPLTRLQERNTYREALITYQLARRTYYAFEDEVARGLRDNIRNLLLNTTNFRIQREAVWAAAQQNELNQESRRISDIKSQPSSQTATRDAVSALRDLLNSQNTVLDVWVTYEVLRRSLDLDLGTMQLDAEGMWIDPGPIGLEQGYPGIGGDEPCWPGDMVMPENGGIFAEWGADPEPLEAVTPPVGHPLPEPDLLPELETVVEPE